MVVPLLLLPPRVDFDIRVRSAPGPLTQATGGFTGPRPPVRSARLCLSERAARRASTSQGRALLAPPSERTGRLRLLDGWRPGRDEDGVGRWARPGGRLSGERHHPFRLKATQFPGSPGNCVAITRSVSRPRNSQANLGTYVARSPPAPPPCIPAAPFSCRRGTLFARLAVDGRALDLDLVKSLLQHDAGLRQWRHWRHGRRRPNRCWWGQYASDDGGRLEAGKHGAVVSASSNRRIQRCRSNLPGANNIIARHGPAKNESSREGEHWRLRKGGTFAVHVRLWPTVAAFPVIYPTWRLLCDGPYASP